MEFSNIESLKSAFHNLGCHEVLIKELSEKQDNSKNQIFLGSNSNEFFALMPGTVRFGTGSMSTGKSHSQKGTAKLEKKLEFYWVEDGQAPALAPNTQIIDYFQYPEIRLSGFLSECSLAPDCLRKQNQSQYGRRVLVMGISGERIFATTVTDANSNYGTALLNAPSWNKSAILKVLPTTSSGSTPLLDPALLLAELGAIFGARHNGQILKNDGLPAHPYNAANGVGYTLESLLGIRSNATIGPDKYGFEIKSISRSVVSLTTTEPDFGFRATHSLQDFLAKYGAVSKNRANRMVFNGKHTPLVANKKSGLILSIANWDEINHAPNGKGAPDISLIDSNGDVASGWTFAHIGSSWEYKHAGAMFVQAKGFAGPPREYLYGPTVWCGMGTSALKLLENISRGHIYLDPGDEFTSTANQNKRTQWRVAKGRLGWGQSLKPFYNNFSEHVL